LSREVSLICWSLALAMGAWSWGDWRGVFRCRSLSAGGKTALAHLALRSGRCALDASSGLRSHSTFHTVPFHFALGEIAGAEPISSTVA